MSKKPNTLSFEDALERLQILIESMENGDIPLDELVAKFEEGTKLLKQCQSKLHNAELKIEKLNVATEVFEALQTESTTKI